MDHKEREEKITKFWRDNKLFEKSIESKPKTKQYVFYDGPPFATGTPHYGHILGLTSKDLFPRYWTMKGYRCERKWGWDCHGLPIENIVEKELGFKDKKKIEEMGINKFNETCRSKVLFFADEWKKTVDRLGKWIEFDSSYKTMDNTYMETIWFMFKKLYGEKLIYEDKKILMYCPHCQTPLAKAEIEMDNSYKEVTEVTAVAKFKLKKEKSTSILAWTTTPWTLIGNVALAINPELTYAKVKNGKEYLILAKSRLADFGNPEVIEEFKGDTLVGKEYEPLYELPTNNRKGYYVINGGSEVTDVDGTGVVHMAIYGEFDYEMIKKYALPIIQHVDKEGKLCMGPKEWIGTWFKKVDELVIKDLEARKLLYEAKEHAHSYPFCYRCKTPLIYNAVDSWFVDIQKIKPTLLKNAELIDWHPETGVKARFKNIIETAPDWTISRNRYWATAIPVWKCSNCKNVEVIGSVKELQEKAIEKIPDNADLHKHYMDEVHLKCDKCKGTMNRIPEVIDCWFESGSMPYASKHYPFENKEYFKTNYPADFISEYIGQVRAWFYYMHVMGVLMFSKPSFKHVVVTGNILGTDGNKMSKSLKNYPEITPTFDKYGADALRFYLMSNPVMRAQDISFNEKDLDNVYKKVIMLLSNISNFYNLFANSNKELNDSSSKHALDKWIISMTNLAIKEVTEALDDYDTPKACKTLIDYVDDLSTWYVRRSRDRFKEGDKNAIKTLAYALSNAIHLIAPISPFITEEVFQELRKNDPALPESIHLSNWPKANPKLIDESLNKAMQQAREIASMALLEREKVGIPVRQALSKLTITGAELSEDLLELIKDELNVKAIETVKKKDLELSAKLDTVITPELLLEGIARELIRKINDYRKEMKLTIKDRITLYIESADKKIKEAISAHGKDIMESVQADKLETKTSTGKEITINEAKARINIKK